MAIITITIPPGKQALVRDTFAAMHPIPVHPEGHAQEGQPQFTENQWIKESMLRYLHARVHEHKRKKAINEIQIPLDKSIAT